MRRRDAAQTRPPYSGGFLAWILSPRSRAGWAIVAAVAAGLGATTGGATTATAAPAAVNTAATAGTVVATADLATRDGAAALGATWRYSDVSIAEAGFRAVGADLKPSGPPNRTYDFSPHAGGRDFDDRAWARLDPTTLSDRRGNGKLSFSWYRTRLTLPSRVNGVDVTGATAVLEIVVDDYAEVWVDGALPRALGQANPPLVQGWNAPNRVVLTPAVRPGQQVQVAVFGINGPISEPPSNYIWVRSARVEFVRDAETVAAAATSSNEAVAPASATPLGVRPGTRVLERRDLGAGELLVVDPAVDAIVPRDARVERLADGFQFGEGPVWSRDGHLLFSDPNTNVIYRYTPGEGVRVERRRSGYDAADIGRYHQPGSNGLTFDRDGRLTIAQHGNRRIVRLEPDGSETVLADRWQGKRLNSPNDLVYRSDGTLYFTDPPFGLPQVFDDPGKEQAFSGLYAWRNGTLRQVARDVAGPNGLAFSPDERTLYLSNWDEKRKVVMRYDVTADGSLRHGRVFFDMTSAPGEEALDGLKVDARGNLYVSGPGGLWILSPVGKHLGTLRVSELPANVAWGDAGGKSLYMTARSGLYRVRLAVGGSAATTMMSAR